MLITGAVICLASASIGLAIKRGYRDRMKFYTDMLAFIDYTVAEIESNKTAFVRIAEEYVSRSDGEFARLVSKFIRGEELSDKPVQWYSRLGLGVDKEIEYACTALADIGRYDSVTELTKLRRRRQEVADREQAAKERYSKDGVMIFNLSVLLGIVIMILIA